MVGCGLAGHTRTHTHTRRRRRLRQQRRRRRAYVASFAVATEAWYKRRRWRRPRQRGRQQPSNLNSSFLPERQRPRRLPVRLRHTRVTAYLAGGGRCPGQPPVGQIDGPTDGRTQRIEQRRRSERLPSCGLVVGVVESDRARSLASTSSSLFTTIECAIRVAPFIAAGPFFASELGQNNARAIAIGRIGEASSERGGSGTDSFPRFFLFPSIVGVIIVFTP